MEKMKKYHRRRFFTIAVSGFIGLLGSRFGFAKYDHPPERPLKEAEFYKKHRLLG